MLAGREQDDLVAQSSKERGVLLSSFLKPSSVAVVGAANDPAKLRGKLLKLVVDSGFDGPIYPIHPRETTIQGMAAYPSLCDLPEPVDLVLIATPGSTVPAIIRDAVSNGNRAAVILSSGVDIDELTAAVGDSGLRYMGPNTEGYFVPGSVAATFSAVVGNVLAGGRTGATSGRKLSIVSQSGGLGFALFGRGLAEHLDFESVVTTGNEGDLECLDFVDHLIDAGESDVIILFIEGLKTPGRFAEIAAKAADRKIPLLVMKIGRSEAGQRAAVSHTAHLTGADTAYDAVFERFGVLRVFDQEELLAAAAALVRFPRVPARRVAVVTTSGGAGAWAADICGASGIEVPLLSEALQAQMAQYVPDFGSTANPVDVTAQAVEDGGRTLVRVLEILDKSDEIDAMVVNMGLAKRGRVAALGDLLEPLFANSSKPILFQSHIKPIDENMGELARLGGQGFHSLRGCASALAALDSHARFQSDWAGWQPVVAEGQPILPVGARGVVEEDSVTRLLLHYRIPMPPSALASTAQQAAESADKMGYPVVLKIQSPDIAHKTEAGGVELGVGAGQVAPAYDRIMANASDYAPNARIEGVLVQKMMPKGHEVVIGVQRDPDFGPLLMIGAGGIYLEVLKDVVFSPLPIDRDRALSLTRRLKTAPILEGVRGEAAGDMDALADLIVQVGELAIQEPALSQFDLNPVFVYPEGQGVVCVDALVVAGEMQEGGDHG